MPGQTPESSATSPGAHRMCRRSHVCAAKWKVRKVACTCRLRLYRLQALARTAIHNAWCRTECVRSVKYVRECMYAKGCPFPRFLTTPHNTQHRTTRSTPTSFFNIVLREGLHRRALPRRRPATGNRRAILLDVRQGALSEDNERAQVRECEWDRCARDHACECGGG